jgi:hypothetical protein
MERRIIAYREPEHRQTMALAGRRPKNQKVRFRNRDYLSQINFLYLI